MNVWVREFDFLLNEAPLPRLLKNTKQKVTTDNALSGRVKSSCSFRYSIKGPTKFLAYSDFVWKHESRDKDVPPIMRDIL